MFALCINFIPVGQMVLFVTIHLPFIWPKSKSFDISSISCSLVIIVSTQFFGSTICFEIKIKFICSRSIIKFMFLFYCLIFPFIWSCLILFSSGVWPNRQLIIIFVNENHLVVSVKSIVIMSLVKSIVMYDLTANWKSDVGTDWNRNSILIDMIWVDILGNRRK